MTTETQTPATSPAEAPPAVVAPQAATPAAAPVETLLTPAPVTPAEQKPAPETAVPGAPEGEKPADTKPSTPEEYAEFKTPEGAAFDPETLTEFKDLAKESGLSQEAAQKLADLGVKNVQRAQTEQLKQIEQLQAKWASDARADKEFGGDKLNENLAVAKKAMESFGSPELSELLNASGLGNHPAIIRAFFRVGKSISQDRLVSGAAITPQDDARKFYPKSNHGA